MQLAERPEPMKQGARLPKPRIPAGFMRSAVAFACSTAICIGCAVGLSGCGTTAVTDFPRQLVGADGTQITLEQIEEIVNNADLDETAKREAIRALGIEDEKLIDALLTL
jgi:hypothetical protein